MALFRYSWLDFLFTCLGLVFLLLDVGLDVLAVVSLYQEEAYVSLAVLLLFLVGSSVLVQAFSWLWYRYEEFRRETWVEKLLSPPQLMVLHLLQLGIYFRHAGVLEVSVLSFCRGKPNVDEDVAVFLNHDLSMLRLIETFSESAPQLVLMLTLILQQGHLEPIRVMKALGSASAIACSVTMYHRSLRSFLQEKQRHGVVSSLVYFLWNLLLVMSRITALALFASTLPCFIFTHFFCSWMLLFFFVWRSKTDFMDSSGGEWLYRATVAIIWYFDWFNVVEGRTFFRTTVYHIFMLVDLCVLCSVWSWKIITEPLPEISVAPSTAVITAVGVVSVYVLGLVFKLVYYKFFHPNLHKKLKGDATTAQDETIQSSLRPAETPAAPLIKVSAPTETPAAPLIKVSAPTETPAAPLIKVSAPTETPAAPLIKVSAPTETPAAPLIKVSTPTAAPAAPLIKVSAPTAAPGHDEPDFTAARRVLIVEDFTKDKSKNSDLSGPVTDSDPDSSSQDSESVEFRDNPSVPNIPSIPSIPTPPPHRCNRRMRKLAGNFYS